MDVITHAAVGAATGAVFGYPVAGAVAGVLPDVVLGIRRRAAPNLAYNLTHSVFFATLVAVVLVLVDRGLAGAVCAALVSHITLDLPTHGRTWAPTLFYPFTRKRFSYGNEWEWFSQDWWHGLWLALLWSDICLLSLCVVR